MSGSSNSLVAGKRVAIGISGGIAAYKTPLLIRLLKKAGAEVRVVATPNALQFTTRWTLETLSENPLEVDIFPEDTPGSTHHIAIAQWPDVFVVAPATANLIGKIASGISDDVLTATLCAYSGSVMLAPAMNSNMYLNPITRRNLTTLREVGYRIIEPDEGEMACHTVGIGRMAEPERMFAEIESFFSEPISTLMPTAKKNAPLTNSTLAGKHIVVSAGPCREPIDPVRFISNRSSGKMGYALAREARDMGARVILISGPVDLAPPDGVELVSVETTVQMCDAILSAIGNADLLIMAAAPADYSPVLVAERKIKKSTESVMLALAPTIDILKEVARKKPRSLFVVGFALETEDLISNAEAKLRDKKLDMIVVNDATEIGSGPGADTNRVTALSRDGSRLDFPRMPKIELAQALLDHILTSMIRPTRVTS